MAAEQKKSSKLSKLDKCPGIHAPSLSGKRMQTLTHIWAKVDKDTKKDDAVKKEAEYAAFIKHIKKPQVNLVDGSSGSCAFVDDDSVHVKKEPIKKMGGKSDLDAYSFVDDWDTSKLSSIIN